MIHIMLAPAALVFAASIVQAAEMTFYQLPAGSFPHDVAPAADGAVWFSGQSQGFAGRFDPKTGHLEKIPLGSGAAPHGVIVGPDGNAWLTEGGQNAIARVDAKSKEVKLFPLPKEFSRANLNTLAFDKNGIVWFTGQSGVYGRANPATGKVRGVEGAERSGSLRHRRHTGGRHLVRIACRRPYCEDRYGERRSYSGGTTEAGRGTAPHLVGFQRRVVGELLARGSDRALRSSSEGLGDLSAAAEQMGYLFDLCR
jgi:hypothetical protein